MRRTLFFSALLLLPLAGCGPSEQNGVTMLTPGKLTVRAVDWNPEKTDLGQVFAVTDLGSIAAVFTDKGMHLVIAGAVNATDGAVTGWESAGVIPAADGEGEWLVGVDDKGQVYAVDALMQVSSISDRYGLLNEHVHEVAALGPTSIAFRLDAQVAVADGMNVTRYDLALSQMAGGGGRVGGVSSGAIHLFNPAEGGKDTVFALPEAGFVTFDWKGTFLAATHHEVYMEDTKGGLAPLVDLSDADVHGLASSPSGVWVAMGTELGLLADGKFNVSTGAALPADAKIVPSSSGDVWALSGGKLSRYSATQAGDETLWSQTVLPVFTRVCSACHLPGGTANTDLSYYGAWVARRELVYKRVIDKMPTPMPPPSAPQMLTPEDITAIQNWVKAGMMPGG